MGGYRYLSRGLALAAFLAVAPAAAAEPPVVRVGVLKFGTVNWEIDVVRHHELDRKNGFRLQTVETAGRDAAAIALQGGAVDVIVTDWIWVSYRRRSGADFTFVTHSHTVGGVMVRPDAGVRNLGDLVGKRIGVGGGPVDKSWLLLRAYGLRTLGVDLAKAAEPVYAAPPLVNQLMLKGDLPVVLNFWHYNARLSAAGMGQFLSIADILPALGIEGNPPLLGWVFSSAWGAKNGAALSGFLRASADAKRLLKESDAEWARIRPLTQAEDDGVFLSLRDAYRRGIGGDESVNEAAASAVLRVLSEFGDADAVGSRHGVAPGTFWRGGGS
jgi:NitT/TauT family transport system substrate-binding protein